jgi:hypothetical protein
MRVESENASEIIFFADPGARPVFDIPPVLHKGEQNTNTIGLEANPDRKPVPEISPG